ncbi:MAG: hypothetical protein IKD73_05810 [Selenomonadaceae bacterium]|nr:hypothetical protein [Selenomonadaceae bacterium]
MKRLVALTALLMMIAAQASAMRLELDPQPVGKVTHYDEAYRVEGASKLSKRVAQFGEGFYLHFDKAALFGDKCKKNTVAVDIRGETTIYRIDNTAGAAFYLIKNDSIGTGDGVKVLGVRDGKWLVFLDALKLREQYDIGWNFHMSQVFTEDNKIIFRYTLQSHAIDVECHWHAVNQKFYPEAIER